MSVQINNKHILEFAASAKTSHQNHLESLINHAIQHTGVFQFTELLAVPSIKNLESVPQLSKSFDLLNLFAYSTYRTYLNSKEKYPGLNDLQIKKLKMLSLIELAQSEKVLGFELLKYELGIQSQDDLEDLIIESIYAGVISGKISQSDRVFRVGSVISRDVKVQDINVIKQKLTRILVENQRVAASLQSKITELNSDKAAQIAEKKRVVENRTVSETIGKKRH